MWPMQVLALVGRCDREDHTRSRTSCRSASLDGLVSDGRGSDANTHDVVDGGRPEVELDEGHG